MQVVPENLNITNGYQIFETPDALYINNQAYDKFTMEPKPFDFFNTNYHINHKNMLKYQINLLEYNYVVPFKEPNYQYIIQDDQDSSIFYCLLESDSNNSNQYICKVRKENDQWKIINNIQPNGSYGFPNQQGIHNYQYKLLGQNDNFLLLYQEKMGATRYDASGASSTGNYDVEVYHSITYIVIEKSTFTARTLNVKNDLHDVGIFFIKKYNNYIYLFENFGTNFNIIKYDLNNNIRTVIGALSVKQTISGAQGTDINNTSDIHMVGISNIIEFNGLYYIFVGRTGLYSYSWSYYRYRLMRINIDFENNIASYHSSIILDDTISFHNATGRSDYLNAQWIKYSLVNINDQYIHITAHNNLNALFYYVHIYEHGRYRENYGGVYTIDNDTYVNNNWHLHCVYENDTCVSKINNLQGQKILGIIYYNKYMPIFLTNTGVSCFRFNKQTRTFETIFENSGTYYTVGIDENDSLYLFDENDNCTTYTVNTVNELKAEFEQEYYNYDNQNINSYISIYSKNFLKDYIKTKVRITLTGQCYFDQNNQKELITYTDKNGIKNIPITITYGGALNCNIQEIE